MHGDGCEKQDSGAGLGHWRHACGVDAHLAAQARDGVRILWSRCPDTQPRYMRVCCCVGCRTVDTLQETAWLPPYDILLLLQSPLIDLSSFRN